MCVGSHRAASDINKSDACQVCEPKFVYVCYNACILLCLGVCVCVCWCGVHVICRPAATLHSQPPDSPRHKASIHPSTLPAVLCVVIRNVTTKPNSCKPNVNMANALLLLLLLFFGNVLPSVASVGNNNARPLSSSQPLLL